MSRYHSNYRDWDPRYNHGEPEIRREVGGGQAWVTRVDPDDPRKKTGIRYYPETDTFVMPPRRNDGGIYMEAREIPGTEFLRRYTGGDAANLRRRRLDELRTTGRIANRETDRWGNPWPADRYDASGHSHDQNPHASYAGQNGTRGPRRRSDAYSVELPGIPEESEAGRAPLLLTQYPHWHEPNRPGSSRHSNRASSRHPSRVASRQSSRR